MPSQGTGAVWVAGVVHFVLAGGECWWCVLVLCAGAVCRCCVVAGDEYWCYVGTGDVYWCCVDHGAVWLLVLCPGM